MKFPQIVDYRVEQTQRGIAVKAVTSGACDTGVVSSHLAAALSRAGLDQPTATISLVQKLELHRETGKLRRFVPLTSP